VTGLVHAAGVWPSSEQVKVPGSLDAKSNVAVVLDVVPVGPSTMVTTGGPTTHVYVAWGPATPF
jgi:hypothetical protein